MSATSMGWIGAGRIARIFLGGWQRARFPLGEVGICDPDAAVIARWQAQFPGVMVGSASELAGRSRWLWLAVHPPQLAAVLTELRGQLGENTVVVSLAPKVPLAKLSELLGGWPKVARVLPNAASIVGRGYNPVAFNPRLAPTDREQLHQLLLPLGEAPEVAEDQLEAYAVITAMGPTYGWFQWQTLEELARRFGMSESQVRPALRAMLLGAVATYFDAGLAPAEVIDLIPVRPLQDQEATIRALLEEKLTAIHQKIKP